MSYKTIKLQVKILSKERVETSIFPVGGKEAQNNIIINCIKPFAEKLEAEKISVRYKNKSLAEHGVQRQRHSQIRIYVASSLGFSEGGRDFYYRKLIPTIQQLGYEVLDPWKITPTDKVLSLPYGLERCDAWRRLNREIGGNNRKSIDTSNGLVAVLDGTDVDSGTAAEIGYAFARGKPIVGYRGDFRLCSDNEGAIVNLQVEYFILASGGTIITEINKLPEALKRTFG